MKPLSMIQWIGLALTVLFTGVFLFDRTYFIIHHLLAVFAVVMTILAETGIYLAKNEGEITSRNAVLIGLLILLMLIAALYVDHTGSYVFHKTRRMQEVNSKVPRLPSEIMAVLVGKEIPIYVQHG